MEEQQLHDPNLKGRLHGLHSRFHKKFIDGAVPRLGEDVDNSSGNVIGVEDLCKHQF